MSIIRGNDVSSECYQPGSDLSINLINLLSPHDALKHHFTSLKNRLNFPTTKGFRTKISMKLVYQYLLIFFNFPPTSNHLYPLQVENCDSNSRLVVDEDDNGKLRLEKVKSDKTHYRITVAGFFWLIAHFLCIKSSPPGV